MASNLDRWIAWARHDVNQRYQQFGQTDDESTYNGATACTHVVLQRLIKAQTGRHYSIDQISTIAGYPWPSGNPNMRGMFSGSTGSSEVERVIAKFGLPYDVRFRMSWASIRQYLTVGPVMLGIRYGWWPEDKGTIYHGLLADGRPNGYALHNGKTQLSGFEAGYHVVLVYGLLKVSDGREFAYASEPNHGSSARPEKPDYDQMLSSQLKKAYDAYSNTGRAPLAWVPTRTFLPKGF